MKQIGVPSLMNKGVRKAINASGGHVAENGVKLPKPLTGNVGGIPKQSSILDGLESEPEYQEFAEKSAFALPLVHYKAVGRAVGGAVGAKTMYDSSRQDGNGSLASMGLAAVGGLAGGMAGHSLGGLAARAHAPAIARAGAEAHAGHLAKLEELQHLKKHPKEIDKMVTGDRFGTFFDTNKPFIEERLPAGISGVKDLYNKHIVGMSDEQLNAARGADHQELRQKVVDRIDKGITHHTAATQHVDNNLATIKSRGVDPHEFATAYSKTHPKGNSAYTDMNNQDFHKQPHAIKTMNELTGDNKGGYLSNLGKAVMGR